MFQVDAGGRHKPDGILSRLARLLWAWLRFATWRLVTVTVEFFSPSRLKDALRPRKRRHTSGTEAASSGDERLDRFH